MINVLANDGIEENIKSEIELLGCRVFDEKIEQEKLMNYINKEDIHVLLVRSSTKVRKDIIDGCPDLKLIIRGGVGMDNIDVEYARGNGKLVHNTPGASTLSVSEITLAHILSLSRNLFAANRSMPIEGLENMKGLKDKYSSGNELYGKTIGVIGCGRIGKDVAAKCIMMGMKVLIYSRSLSPGSLSIPYTVQENQLSLKAQAVSLDELLIESDFVTLHVPSSSTPLIGKRELLLMKDTSILINVARGGVVDEEALIEALNNKRIAKAALDVYEHEPHPKKELLEHPAISMTPHIGASTPEAQAKIGDEIKNIIYSTFFETKS